MILLVGLGNPGQGYSENRHNFGFMAADEIVRRHSFNAPRKRFHGHVQEGQIDGHKIMILKPATYMNESGAPLVKRSGSIKYLRRISLFCMMSSTCPWEK